MYHDLSGQADTLRRLAGSHDTHGAARDLVRAMTHATKPKANPKATPAKAAPSAPARRKIPTKQKPPKGYTKLDRRRHTKKGPPRYVAV
jgi:hypothetical protein